MVYHRILNAAPCAPEQDLVYLPMYNSLRPLTPPRQIHSSPTLLAFDYVKSALYVCDPVCVL